MSRGESSPAGGPEPRISKFTPQSAETSRQAFCLGSGGDLLSKPSTDVYSAREIALAAGVSEARILAILGGRPPYFSHDEAVRIGHLLGAPAPLFALVFTPTESGRSKGVPLALSSTLHGGVLGAFMLMTTLGLTPTATTPATERSDPLRLVFLTTPGPGGGGGGGGLLHQAPPPKALREGRHSKTSPIPRREPPKPIVPTPAPPEPKPEPPLKAEQLPVVVAPLMTAPSDARDRIGALRETTAANDSHGPGKGGGAGTGAGTGLGEGDRAGVGPGSGGGTGGGPYRPGSGIEPPTLLREVRADYTEDARRRGLTGDVVLEIVVRRDGGVGDIKVLQGLGSGLNDRAVQAVRQWRFSPARHQGVPVDVIVEVAVEFELR